MKLLSTPSKARVNGNVRMFNGRVNSSNKRLGLQVSSLVIGTLMLVACGPAETITIGGVTRYLVEDIDNPEECTDKSQGYDSSRRPSPKYMWAEDENGSEGCYVDPQVYG